MNGGLIEFHLVPLMHRQTLTLLGNSASTDAIYSITAPGSLATPQRIRLPKRNTTRAVKTIWQQ